MKRIERRIRQLEAVVNAQRFDEVRLFEYLGAISSQGVSIEALNPCIKVISIGLVNPKPLTDFSETEIEMFSEWCLKKRVEPETLTPATFERIMMDVLPPIQILSPDLSLDEL